MPIWIRKPGNVHVTILQRHFSYASDPYSGFAFNVDEKTNTVILKTPQARENFAKCLAGLTAGTMIDHGTRDYGRDHWDAGAIKCHCGRVLELADDWEGTRCECGSEYDSSGQELRANWREFCRETGELTDDDFLS